MNSYAIDPGELDIQSRVKSSIVCDTCWQYVDKSVYVKNFSYGSVNLDDDSRELDDFDSVTLIEKREEEVDMANLSGKCKVDVIEQVSVSLDAEKSVMNLNVLSGSLIDECDGRSAAEDTSVVDENVHPKMVEASCKHLEVYSVDLKNDGFDVNFNVGVRLNIFYTEPGELVSLSGVK
ncbi:OLC1v1005048C1 [Oldenlandia corymbosa var. corymbosa]|uniref:OLC1v1005048C1 n=1 Tax=Oldenlandia corymbosa var. corymbosa TaxID=529605 RepID=A0AAV1DDR2_OLDCO|nr:OLC1v1005048C1 [Oldenlandia corymbosa var. corymbosa]